MHAHKAEYVAAKEEFTFLVQELIVRISGWDSRLPHLEVKDCVFRFNRDTRFSDNKNPYKENFGAFLSYGGKKGGLPGYYIHVAATEIFVAGGVWMPEADKLVRIRREIINHGDALERILKAKKFKKTFTALNTEDVLKRLPKGFPAGHKHMELLKLKSYTASAPLSLEQALKPGFVKIIDQHFKLLQPLNDFLYKAVSITKDI